MQEQAGLGTRKIHRKPVYTETDIARVTSTKDYNAYGRIEVIFINYGQPFPVWVSGSVDREPASGDLVLISYIQGRADAPYMAGFVRNESHTSNFIRVEKDKILLQVPTDSDDILGHLLDDTKKSSRTILEITASGATLNGKRIATID